jgi:hypothetical protein
LHDRLPGKCGPAVAALRDPGISNSRASAPLSITAECSRPGGSYACTILATSLAVVDGTDGRHRDANERRKVAEDNVRLSRGTLGGAIYGGAIGFLIPHSNEIALLAVLAFAVAPLALLAAINPRFSVAPITAIIVLLVPMMTHASQIASALDRVLEVALGGVIGLVVSFLLMPSSARPLVVAVTARTLEAGTRLQRQSPRRGKRDQPAKRRPNEGGVDIQASRQ